MDRIGSQKIVSKPVAFIFSSLLFIGSIHAQENIVQTKNIEFPNTGKVTVCAIEETSNYPKLIIYRQNSREVIFQHIANYDEDFKIAEETPTYLRPIMRFLEISSPNAPHPLILAIAVRPGGSDSDHRAIVIGESGKTIQTLVLDAIRMSNQGGIYIGYLNKKYGFGIVSWTFIWDSGAHYGLHPYEVEVFSLSNGRFIRASHVDTKNRYRANGVKALMELGIKGYDLRKDMPDVHKITQ